MKSHPGSPLDCDVPDCLRSRVDRNKIEKARCGAALHLLYPNATIHIGHDTLFSNIFSRKTFMAVTSVKQHITLGIDRLHAITDDFDCDYASR